MIDLVRFISDSDYPELAIPVVVRRDMPAALRGIPAAAKAALSTQTVERQAVLDPNFPWRISEYADGTRGVFSLGYAGGASGYPGAIHNRSQVETP